MRVFRKTSSATATFGQKKKVFPLQPVTLYLIPRFLFAHQLFSSWRFHL
jgi:hypothetical protein